MCIIIHSRKSFLFSENLPWKKKDSEGCFDVTMGRYDGAEICGIYILSHLSTITDKNDCGLYRDDGLLVLHNVNEQPIDRVRKNAIQWFKDINLPIDIETNLKIVNFLNITFNLNNGTSIIKLFIAIHKKCSNHPPHTFETFL